MNICLFCGRTGEEGIRIFQQLICPRCERDLLCTDATDPRYPGFVQKMKSLWPAGHAGVCR